jgi:hypothetical protein
MDYSFHIWLNHKYDKNLYRYNIIDKMYQMTLDKLKDLGLELNDEEYFFKQFVYFIYLNSTKKTYRGINILDIEKKNTFDDLFIKDLIKLYNNLQEYITDNAFNLLNNIENKKFIDIIFKNVEFNIDNQYDSDNEVNEDIYYD